MFSADHLFLKLLRLRSPELWESCGNSLNFLFLKAGDGEYRSGTVRHRLSPGDVLVLNGDPNGKLCPREGGELVLWCFSLNVEHLYPLFSSSEIPFLQDIIQALKRTRHYPAATPVATECHGLVPEMPPRFDFTHRSHLLRVAAAVIADELKKGRTNRTGYISAQVHLAQIFEGLSFDELLNLSVDGLAAKFGCSRRHLSRLFNHHIGLSIGALRMEMRLLKAITLLRNPDAKVINVAEECGFNHLGLFNTCFKRRFGTSPGQWRKGNTGQPAAPSAAGAVAGREQKLERIGLSPSFPGDLAANAAPGVDSPALEAEKKSFEKSLKSSLLRRFQAESDSGDLAAPALVEYSS